MTNRRETGGKMGEAYFPRATVMRCVFATLFSLVICLQSNDYNISEYIRHFYTFMFSIKMTIFMADEIISLCLTGTRAIQLILSVKYSGCGRGNEFCSKRKHSIYDISIFNISPLFLFKLRAKNTSRLIHQSALEISTRDALAPIGATRAKFKPERDLHFAHVTVLDQSAIRAKFKPAFFVQSATEFRRGDAPRPIGYSFESQTRTCPSLFVVVDKLKVGFIGGRLITRPTRQTLGRLFRTRPRISDD
jgi:hypothetical protein